MRKKEDLIKFRESIDKTQEEMADILGISVSYYSKIEKGERNPSFNFITKFKEKFGVSIEPIFFKSTSHIECDEEIA
ncbi:MAG: helix-turn-helix domain-containing protein [Bacillota bacterium]